MAGDSGDRTGRWPATRSARKPRPTTAGAWAAGPCSASGP